MVSSYAFAEMYEVGNRDGICMRGRTIPYWEF